MGRGTAVACLIVTFLLSSCFTGKDVYDHVGVSHPVVSVSSNVAAVGEPIEVTVANYLHLPQRSRVDARSAEVELGVCLLPDWSDLPDNCDPATYTEGAEFQTSEAFSVPPGHAVSKRVFVTVARAQTVPLDHSFTITANRPGTVRLIGKFVSYRGDEIPGDVACVKEECETVVWE